MRLANWSDRPGPIGPTLQQSLCSMTFHSLLNQTPHLTDEVRRRAGRVVLRIDPDAIDTLRDGLRHPVIDHRFEAIEWIASQGLLELLGEEIGRGLDGEHRRLRERLAVRLGDARGPITHELLVRLSHQAHPEISRQAAASLARRAKNSANPPHSYSRSGDRMMIWIAGSVVVAISLSLTARLWVRKRAEPRPTSRPTDPLLAALCHRYELHPQTRALLAKVESLNQASSGELFLSASRFDRLVAHAMTRSRHVAARRSVLEVVRFELFERPAAG